MIYTSDVEYLMRYNNLYWNRHDRQAVYDICKALGFSSDNARRMRDWTLSHIALCSQKMII